jgi:hypothetical protein
MVRPYYGVAVCLLLLVSTHALALTEVEIPEGNVIEIKSQVDQAEVLRGASLAGNGSVYSLIPTSNESFRGQAVGTENNSSLASVKCPEYGEAGITKRIEGQANDLCCCCDYPSGRYTDCGSSCPSYES